MTYESHIAYIRNLQEQLQSAHAAMVADNFLDSQEFLDSIGNNSVDKLQQSCDSLDEWLYDQEQAIANDN